MIIVVNVRRSLHPSVNNSMQATSRAWALSLARCSNTAHKYVVGVINGNVAKKCYFEKIMALQDHQFPNRVAIKLSPCNKAQRVAINNHLIGINLTHIQRGKYV